jgi:thioredoxin reductase/NAD-dependent dihydropyrimidine dehydrogenase PreA subunit
MFVGELGSVAVALDLNALLHPDWLMKYAPALVLGLAVLALLARQAQLRRYARSHGELLRARERGSHQARLQHPEIDLSACIGCGACVRACPEEGVLELLHGQAVVVHGSRCVGHGACATACPTGAISLTLGDLSRRRDLPALGEDLQAVGVPGLFLAGEVSGFALVRTAVTQGIAVADAAAHRSGAIAGGARSDNGSPAPQDVLDLLIVGLGPGGLACSLRARERGLRFAAIDQESSIGGSIAKYPRRKMVMTAPVDLPLHGGLTASAYQKEDLIALWEGVARRHELPVRTGVRLLELARDEHGVFVATTSKGAYRARSVCLAVGRRGSPRKLGVPGEELSKVAYSLIDADSYRGRRILVVGGGDSAVEAALGLADQPGNEVTLCYRKGAFVRIRAANDARVARAIQEHRVTVLFGSEVAAIEPDCVHLTAHDGGRTRIANDDVFIFAGGDPPFALLERAGVSFDASLRPRPAPLVERGSGLLSSVGLTFLCAVLMAGWAIAFRAYYTATPADRIGQRMHGLLRPSGPVGLWAGIGACGLFAWNLAYLLRRSRRWGKWLPGSLRRWMNWHVFTGLTALPLVLLHAGFTAPQNIGGHALIALGLVVLTGSIGRYLYAFMPRAANGAEATLEDLRTRLAAMSAEWDRTGRGFGEAVRQHVEESVTRGRWRSSFFARVGVLITGQLRLRRILRQLHHSGTAEGVPEHEVVEALALARRAYWLTLLVTHYDEIGAVLSSWRYFHRWLALLMVLLAAAHVVTAARYASFDFDLARWVTAWTK